MNARSPVGASAVTLVALAAVVLLRWLLDPWLGDHLPLATVYVAVAVVVWVGGYRPAVVVAALGYLACDWLFIEPRGEFGLTAPRHVIALALYVTSCGIIISFCEAMRSARRRSDAARAQLEREILHRRKAEEELRRRTEEVERVLQALPAAVWVAHDAECRTVTGNAYAERLHAGGPGGNVSADLPADEWRWVRQVRDGRELAAGEFPLQRAAATGGSVEDFECDLELPGGRTASLLCNAVPLRDADGRVRGAVAACLDVTPLKAAERRVRESEQRFRLAAEAVNGIIYECDLRTGRVQRTRGLYEVLGHRPEDVPPTESWWLGQVHPDDRDRVSRVDLRDAPACGGPVEYRVRHKDGRWLYVEDRAVVLRDAGGHPVKLVGCTVDVTGRRLAEQRLAAVLASIDDHLVCYDHGWRYTYANDAAARALGRPAGELLGRCIWDLFPDAVGNQYHRELHDAARERRVVRSEHYYAPFDRWFENHIYPTPDGVTVFSADVTERKRAEAALRERDEQLRVVTDVTPALVSYVDAGGRYRFVNRQYELWFGRPREEIVGRTMTEVLGPAAVGVLRPHLDAALRGEAVRFEREMPYRDGGTRWIDAQYVPDKAPGGAVRGLFVFVQDVTERKRTGEALAEAARALVRERERLAVALRAGRLGVYEWRVGEASVWWSPEVYPVYGVDPATFTPTTEALGALVHPDDRAGLWRKTDESLARGEEFAHEYRVVRPDGEVRWVANRSRVGLDAAGRAERITGVAADVTEAKRAEAALRAGEERFRTMANTTPAIIWTADPAGAITFHNRRWLDYTGLTAEENADSPRRVLHPDDHDRCVRAWRQALEAGTEYEIEVRNRRRDGEYRWFLTRATPIRDAAGRVVEWYGSSTDIHEQKRAEDLLREADRRKDEFIATLAHELRNPLAPVGNSLELMRRAAGDPARLEQARATMERQVAHLVRLVDDLLDVSRITRNKLELKPERVALADVVRHAAEAARPQCERAGHRLTVSLPADPVHLRADPVRLAQVFGNLLANACKYTDPGGHIRLTAERRGGGVEVAVEDTGAGIPPDMLDKVFDLFTQVDRPLERSAGGLGIGLSLVKRLVEMHGGTVTARSAGEGRGSTFVVRLPVPDGEPDARPRPEPRRDPAPAGRRVLVVDDNRDGAETLAELLRLTGNETATAHDGVEAVERAEAFRPDAILLDLGLPGISGFEACRRIRERPWGRGVLVVALTGWGQDDDRRRSKEAGFDAHLVKPVDHAALAKLLAAQPAPAAG